MSGTRPPPNPWLADHVIFFMFRWLSWALTLLWLLVQGMPGTTQSWALLTAVLVNILATMLAQPYLRVARRNPAIMLLDIVYGVALLLFSGGWESAFMLYACSGLVLPALMYGWRGGVMAGLTFVTIDLGALSAAGAPPADRIFDGSSGLTLALTMVVPPLIGAVVHPLVEALRAHMAHQRRSDRMPPGPPGPRSRRSPPLDTSSLVRDREPRRIPLRDGGEPSTAVQAARTRTVEGVDELRRVLFAPLSSVDMDLGQALEALASRYGQHTATAIRVTQLGRARHVQRAQRQLLIRLAQEALLNIHQHAQASSVMITLRYDALSVALMIQDDGVGLLDGTYERPGLHALRAMQYRLAEHDGRLDVFELEGGGVTVRASLPLD